MKETIKIGVIGLGCRGLSLLETVMLPQQDVEVIAVCDIYKDRREKAVQMVEKGKGTTPFSTENYKEIFAMKEVDAVILATAWEYHINLACEAMQAGKYVGMEVGGAYSIEDCWKLIRTYEQTKIPCMMLENCCYGRDELLILNMVRQGIFGEIVHCEGGYCHDLRKEISFGRENRHYRFRNYLNRNGENYPTHELGPIAKILNINHGNRMLTLSSTASKSAGLHEYLMEQKGTEYDASNMNFMQGDIVTTVIKCAHGEPIVLSLDTTLPRPYSRRFQIRGTKAMFFEDNRSIYLDKEHEKFDFCWQKQWNNIENYQEQYDHSIWKDYIKEGIRGGHDGMDWLVFRAFFDCIKNQTEVPIDVYDTATWMSITALSEQSVAMGGMPVAIPDFTNGMWISRKQEVPFL